MSRNNFFEKIVEKKRKCVWLFFYRWTPMLCMTSSSLFLNWFVFLLWLVASAQKIFLFSISPPLFAFNLIIRIGKNERKNKNNSSRLNSAYPIRACDLSLINNQLTSKKEVWFVRMSNSVHRGWNVREIAKLWLSLFKRIISSVCDKLTGIEIE